MADILLVDVRKAFGAQDEKKLKEWYHQHRGARYEAQPLETVSEVLQLSDVQKEALEDIAERRTITALRAPPILREYPSEDPTPYWEQTQRSKDALSVYTIAHKLPPASRDSFLLRILEDQKSLLKESALELTINGRPIKPGKQARAPTDKRFTSLRAAEAYLEKLNKEKSYLVSDASLETFRKGYGLRDVHVA